MKSEVKNTYNFLIEQGFSKETAHVLLRLLNYTNNKIIPDNELQEWKKFGIVSDDGNIMVDKKSAEIDAFTLVLFGMVWEGNLIREFDEEKNEFVYGNTIQGMNRYDKIIGNPIGTTLKENKEKVIWCFIDGIKSDKMIADELNFPLGVVQILLNELKNENMVQEFSIEKTN